MAKKFYIFSIALIVCTSCVNAKVQGQNNVLQFKNHSQKQKFELFQDRSNFVQATSDPIINEEDCSIKGPGLIKYSVKRTIWFSLTRTNARPSKKLYSNNFIIFESDNSPPTT